MEATSTFRMSPSDTSVCPQCLVLTGGSSLSDMKHCCSSSVLLYKAVLIAEVEISVEEKSLNYPLYIDSREFDILNSESLKRTAHIRLRSEDTTEVETPLPYPFTDCIGTTAHALAFMHFCLHIGASDVKWLTDRCRVC
uniref:Uncharacterized protein n=1 Tax=Echinococcus canadensis TaxID=519352 RepID=A0A915EWN7_9CEST